MNTKVNKAYFLIPVLYTAVIVFLLYMQFSGSRAFSAEVSGMSVEGRTHAGAPGRDNTITDFNLSCNGVVFSFGGNNPLIVHSQDGLEHRTVPLDYRVTASGIDITMAKDIGISFYRINNKPDDIIVNITAGDPASIKYISLPVSGQKGTVVSSTEGVPVLSIESEQQGNYYLTLPEGTLFDSNESVLVIYPEEGVFSELAFERSADSGLDAFTYWLNGNFGHISEQELQNKIDKYLTDSIEALENKRFDPASGTWTSATGRKEFNEEAMLVMLAEQTGKSGYAQTIEELDAAAEKTNRSLGILSTTQFGNIVNICWNYENEQEELARTFSKKAASADYKVFSEKDLYKTVLSEDSDELVDDLLSMTENIKNAEIDVYTASGMLMFYRNISRYNPELGRKFSLLTTVLENSILPSLKIISEGIYLTGNGDTADIMLSLKTGFLMMEIAPQNDSENIKALGRDIIDSALSLADGSGFLPQEISGGDNGEISEFGSINPETIYPLLSDNTYYPAEDYFYLQTDEKISVINQADNFNIEKTDYGYRLSFDYPAGRIHTFAVRNFKPFAQMNLLGYVWNADHRFLQYFSGWWYDSTNQTLFVKIRHRQKTEEILIYTRRPPAPAPEPAEDSGATSAGETSEGNADAAGESAAEQN